MLSDVAWKAFEVTGNVDAYVLYKNLKKGKLSGGEVFPEISEEISPRKDEREGKDIE